MVSHWVNWNPIQWCNCTSCNSWTSQTRIRIFSLFHCMMMMVVMVMVIHTVIQTMVGSFFAHCSHSSLHCLLCCLCGGQQQRGLPTKCRPRASLPTRKGQTVERRGMAPTLFLFGKHSFCVCFCFFRLYSRWQAGTLAQLLSASPTWSLKCSKSKSPARVIPRSQTENLQRIEVEEIKMT